VRGAGGSMYQYLYAIADRLPAAWRPPGASVGGPVELRRLGDLVVLVSQLDRLPEANARTLALHHDVVASTLDASGTVPFRFGVVVAAVDLDARAEVDGFLARIAPIASRAAGIAVVPTGPWPPYSFVPSFDRFPLARLGEPERKIGRRA